jgi:hypothetical protein
MLESRCYCYCYLHCLRDRRRLWVCCPLIAAVLHGRRQPRVDQPRRRHRALHVVLAHEGLDVGDLRVGADRGRESGGGSEGRVREARVSGDQFVGGDGVGGWPRSGRGWCQKAVRRRAHRFCVGLLTRQLPGGGRKRFPSPSSRRGRLLQEDCRLQPHVVCAQGNLRLPVAAPAACRLGHLHTHTLPACDPPQT